MKLHLFFSLFMVSLLLSSCKGDKTSVGTDIAGSTQIPDILLNHRDYESFTGLKENPVPVSLFNGKDFSGWYTYTENLGKNHPEETAFTVTEEGIACFDAQPMGYICTNDTYKNYYLKVVFRWGDKKYPPREDAKRDSGILYHFSPEDEDKLWPKSIECQIQETDCGDYFFIGGTHGESPNETVENGSMKRVIKTVDYENPYKEWNVIEVICVDNRSEHYVNGHLVNEASNLSSNEGKILLQLEAAEVYYKTVEMISLK